MISSGLAFTVLTLTATLAALDLSGAHQLPASQQVSARASTIHMNQPAREDDIEARLTRPLVHSRSTPAAESRAIHRCATAANAGHSKAQYCFGAPAPEIIYD